MFTRDAPITDHDTSTRTLQVQLLRWDDPRLVSDGGRPYREVWARDALIPLDRLGVWDRHHGELIGRMDPPEDAGPGPVSTVHIAHTRAGDDLLALVDAEVIRDVSIEFAPEPGGEVWSADRSEVTRTRAKLRGVAFTVQGAHDAPILQRTESRAMPEETPHIDQADPPGSDTTSPPVLTRADPAVTDELTAIRGELVAMRDRTPVAPTWQYRTVGEWLVAAYDHKTDWPDRDPLDAAMGNTGRVLLRAWTDITTSDIPGLVQPQQLREIYDLIRTVQPLVEAAGSAPAPTSRTITYPKITLRPTVAPQAVEKTEIASSDTTVGSNTVNVMTIAGGNDVSVQAIDWSDPSVLTLLGQLYAEQLAKNTDQAAYSAYDTAATINASIGTDPKLWVTKFFDLAGQILTASGRFPDRLVLSTDLWVKIGGAVDADGRPIFTAASPMNPAGSASLTSPTGDVRELGFVVDPWIPADRGLMFSSAGFRASIGPVSTMAADNPAKLGRDVAWYRYCAFLAVDPASMALFASGTAPTAAAASRAK